MAGLDKGKGPEKAAAAAGYQQPWCVVVEHILMLTMADGCIDDGPTDALMLCYATLMPSQGREIQTDIAR